MLFQLDVTGDPVLDVQRSYLAGKTIAEDVREFACGLVGTVAQNRQRIDALIEEAGASWRLERMAVVDRSLLRLAIAELLSPGGAPPAVVINEAIEIAKRYSAPEAAAFVNGILDAVRRRLEAEGALPHRDPSDASRDE